MNSIDVINKYILNNQKILSYRVFSFSFDNKIQSRLKEFKKEELDSIELAKAYKSMHSISFWESYLRICDESNNIQRRLTDGVLFHNPNSNYLYFENDGCDVLEKLPSDVTVALNSEVILSDGLKRHIPLLDFKILATKESLPIVEEVIHALNLKGYILDSGKSYHFIGKGLLTRSELVELLAKFVLLHPVSDKSWASHQIIEGSSSLRITEKEGELPTLVKVLE